jgi:diguanylate cyclase (GGDEF)-like protein
MGRSFPYLRGRDRMAEDRSKSGSFVEDGHPTKSESLYRSKHRLLVVDRHKTNLRKSRRDGPACAPLTEGKDLARILRQVDDIAMKLKSNPPDAQALSMALHRTVLCAIKQTILDSELGSLALTDDLTNLYNRRAFHALAAQQLNVMRRKGQGLLLFFADVDRLKQINDSYGHREGDLALIRTADALQRTFRNSDILARISGDEFAVLALEADGQDRDAILRRLEGQLQKAGAVERRYKLSLSVGVARFDSKHGGSLGDLLARADQEMYEDKGANSKLTASRW